MKFELSKYQIYWHFNVYGQANKLALHMLLLPACNMCCKLLQLSIEAVTSCCCCCCRCCCCCYHCSCSCNIVVAVAAASLHCQKCVVVGARCCPLLSVLPLHISGMSGMLFNTLLYPIEAMSMQIYPKT